MASAPKKAPSSEIEALVATLAGRQNRYAEADQAAHRPGARRRADARARRAAWRQNLEPARRRRPAPAFDRDVDARHRRIPIGRGAAAGIRRPAVGIGRAARQLRRHRAPAAAIPAAGARRRHHGRNPRPRRPQHVGEARQRPGRGAGELSQERIPADRRRGAVEAPARACRARARDPAGGALARRRQPHAQDGGGAEGGAGARRGDACAPNSCRACRRPAAATPTR